MESKKTPSQKLKEILAQDPDNWVTKESREAREKFKQHLLQKKNSKRSEPSASSGENHEE